MKKIDVIKCDFYNPLHCEAVVELMRAYMQDVMGDSPILDAKGNERLIAGLQKQENLLTLLAYYDGKYVGLTNCFVNFATFAAQPFINIHDLIVLHECRGMSIGKLLLAEITRIAKEELNCSKITLEVREDNTVAQNLYKSFDFGNANPNMLFYVKELASTKAI